MSIFTLVILCLTTSNLFWFMDLTFQVPMRYCSVQHQTLISTPDRLYFHHRHSHKCHFCFGPAASFFLELLVIALCSSPSSILNTFWPGGLIFWCQNFLLYHDVHGVLVARILERVAISSSSRPHLSGLFIMTCPSKVGLCGMVYSFLELCKPLQHEQLWSMKQISEDTW